MSANADSTSTASLPLPNLSAKCQGLGSWLRHPVKLFRRITTVPEELGDVIERIATKMKRAGAEPMINAPFLHPRSGRLSQADASLLPCALPND